MSNIVAFKRDHLPRAAWRRGDHSGHILLFTGVRYVREGNDGDSGHTGQPSVAAPDTRPVGERLKA